MLLSLPGAVCQLVLTSHQNNLSIIGMENPKICSIKIRKKSISTTTSRTTKAKFSKQQFFVAVNTMHTATRSMWSRHRSRWGFFTSVHFLKSEVTFGSSFIRSTYQRMEIPSRRIPLALRKRWHKPDRLWILRDIRYNLFRRSQIGTFPQSFGSLSLVPSSEMVFFSGNPEYSMSSWHAIDRSPIPF